LLASLFGIEESKSAARYAKLPRHTLFRRHTDVTQWFRFSGNQAEDASRPRTFAASAHEPVDEQCHCLCRCIDRQRHRRRLVKVEIVADLEPCDPQQFRSIAYCISRRNFFGSKQLGVL
jgi:hypothetical protein